MVALQTPRRARKKAETRNRIVSTAVEIFSARGIEQATVDEIAAAADVGKGTIYNYFATKEDIVVAFVVDIERHVQRDVARLSLRGPSLEAVLVRFVQRQFTLKAPHHRFVRVFLTQMFARTDAFMPWMQELQTVVDPPLVTLFSGLQEKGLLRSDIAMPVLVQAFKTMHLGLTAVWAIEGPPWNGTTALVRTQVRLFCEGLKAVQR